ncbi:MAG: hypothetical protein C0407_17835 [Desulfobacca sp.]|nr:hypothetical protein [Desulfobacca sp.]
MSWVVGFLMTKSKVYAAGKFSRLLFYRNFYGKSLEVFLAFGKNGGEKINKPILEIKGNKSRIFLFGRECKTKRSYSLIEGTRPLCFYPFS